MERFYRWVDTPRFTWGDVALITGLAVEFGGLVWMLVVS